MSIIFFIRYQRPIGATTQQESEYRSDKHEKNLHMWFLPMHRIGRSGKWQVASGCWESLFVPSIMVALCVSALLVFRLFGEWLKGTFTAE